MKKLFYTILAASIIFSSCKKQVGCMDPTSSNYNSSAIVDDGSCIPMILGCTDPTAFNYNPTATFLDYCSYTLNIGDIHQGGIIFWLDGNGGGLIAAPSDQSTNAEWGCYGTLLSGADGIAVRTGAQNTIDIEAGCTAPGIAADICANLTLNGYSDWFLPSLEELNEMYLNKIAIGGFANNAYWSSTEGDSNFAVYQNFTNGVQSASPKHNNFDVRAVRTISSSIPPLLGCTDPTAFNYDPIANTDDGSCIAIAFGCTDSTAVNYDPLANTDDGSCCLNGNLCIGSFYQGGIIFWLDGNGGGLIAAPSDQSTGAEWGCNSISLAGADGIAIGTGTQNTIDIEAGCTTPGIAADICANLTLNGYSDWFLPSRDELNEMYVNLYLQGFVGFASNYYWSSTEYDFSNAWGQYFNNGSQLSSNKGNVSGNVRAVRAF
jgi:hypothetical protein